jgi:hypothetical protein
MNAQSQPACRLHINLLETAHPLSLACTSINLDAASDKTLPRSCDCPGGHGRRSRRGSFGRGLTYRLSC